MKFKIIIICVMLFKIGISQNEIVWDGIYQLSLKDIKSSSTQIGNTNINSVFIQNSMSFEFQMSNFEFMITKNFNKKVKNVFRCDLAYIVATDTATAIELVSFSRFIFDLNELYSRKLRKKLYEEKNAFSDTKFFKPIFDEISKELSEKGMNASKETNFGLQKEKLKKMHQDVLTEIQSYSNFCFNCKPKKVELRN